jgi:hypothetical protein
MHVLKFNITLNATFPINLEKKLDYYKTCVSICKHCTFRFTRITNDIAI